MPNPPKGEEPATHPELAPDSHAMATHGELGRLTEVLRVLESLSKPPVSPVQLAEALMKIPLLAARITREYAGTSTELALPTFPEQLEALGTRRLEALLYRYLEDLMLARGDDDS